MKESGCNRTENPSPAVSEQDKWADSHENKWPSSGVSSPV